MKPSASPRWLSFYWHQFLTGFCYHIPLPATLLVIVALVLGEIGGGFGLPLLIWHEQRLEVFFVGFALGLVWMESLLVGYLLLTGHPESKHSRPTVGFLRFG
jgi:hypothetical protein